jgi:hypothetical protein
MIHSYIWYFCVSIHLNIYLVIWDSSLGIPLVNTTTAVGQLFIAEEFSYIYANFLAEEFRSSIYNRNIYRSYYSLYHHVHYTSA